MRSFYDFLVFEGLAGSNPVNTGRLKVKKPEHLPCFLTPAEKEVVLAWMATKPPHVALILTP